jgi:hypothetical protein
VIGLPYCWTHLLSEKNLRIKASTLPDAGKGLFAQKKNAGTDIIFRKDDSIIQYQGQEIDGNQLQMRYDDFTAPYGIQLNKGKFEDGACKRGAGNLVNHASSSSGKVNAQFVIDTRRNRVVLKAIKNIRNDTEIFVNYGRDYGFNEGTRYTTTYVKN